MKITNFSGCTHTREDAPQTTPNHLEASFKSNKRESTVGDASSAHETERAAHTVKGSSLTPQSISHPSPSSNPLKDLLKNGSGKWSLSSWRCSSRVESAANEGGGEGVYIPEPPKLAVTVLLCTYRNFLQLCRNFLQKLN